MLRYFCLNKRYRKSNTEQSKAQLDQNETNILMNFDTYCFILKYYFAQGKSGTFNKNSLILAAP
jgi:hypothetical protein